ncbi:cell wall-binding repeat-containing protein, partial [Microvirga sp. 3-52]|nr:cell wall-binding repeat-containing protein [Microvirga sp. 3-52]
LVGDNPENLYIWSYDNLLNSAVETVNVEEIPTEAGEPFIFLNSPGLLDFYGEKVNVQGYVAGYEGLDKVLLGKDEIEANLEYKESVTIYFGSWVYEGPAYEFTKELTLEDGYHELSVKAIAKDGSEDSIMRRMYVDTTAPTLEVTVEDRDLASNKATLKFVMKDNFPFFKLTENGNELYKFNGFNDSIIAGPDEKTIEKEMSLDVGENSFTFVLSDILGQTSEVTLNVNRGSVDDLSESYSGSDRYGTAVEISQAEFENADTVVLASGVNFPDAL